MTTEPAPDMRRVPLADFIEQAAAKTPTPGGGSVAAVVGALGASMLAMAVNFTRGSDKFKAVAELMDGAADELTRARAMFLELMNEDMAAFSQWQSAWRMDKSDPARPEALKVATATAIAVPQELASLALTVLQKIAQLADKVNTRLLSDVGVAAVLTEAALRAAHYNIRVNLAAMGSPDDEAALRAEMASQTQKARGLLSQVEAKLAGQF